VRLTEWALKPSIVLHIFQIMGTPSIDLFATRANSQLPVFAHILAHLEGDNGKSYLSFNILMIRVISLLTVYYNGEVFF
jgi:hypothetical protein